MSPSRFGVALLLIIVGIPAVPLGHAQQAPAPPNSFPPRALLQHFQEIVTTETIAADEIRAWVATQQGDGSWPDIDYADQTGMDWQPFQHSRRTRLLAVAYSKAGGEFAKDPKLRHAIRQALLFWKTKGLKCHNWWHNEIGSPKELGTALLLLKAELSEEERELAKIFATRTTINRAGQNGVWAAEVDLLCALVLDDEPAASKAVEKIFEHVAVPRWEGLKTDYAFHQHGPQHQFGTYGLAFGECVSTWMAVLQGTPYGSRIPSGCQEVFRCFLLEGLGFVVWGGSMDISALGRHFYPESTLKTPGKGLSLHGPCAKSARVNAVLGLMRGLDREHAREYQAALDANTPGGTNRLVGLHHYFQSDFAVCRRPDYYFSVRGSSTRIALGEGGGTENALGHYLGDGAAYLMHRGDEYRDIFPVWDWRKLPGITAPQSGPLPQFGNGKIVGGSAFTGGVSDGTNGLFAMEVLRDGLSARKAWFMHDRVIVCLGAGITIDRDVQVATTLNQCLLKGPVYAWRYGKKEIWGKEANAGVDAVEHDGFTYVFPKPTNIRLSAGAQSGKWSAVTRWFNMQDDPVEKNVFLLWLDHGSRCGNADYSYAISAKDGTPGTRTPAEIRGGFTILANQPAVQAVRFGSQMQVVFWAPGRVALAEGVVETDQPCVLMLDQKNSAAWKLEVADPTHKLKSAVITMAGRRYSIQFPQKPSDGAAVQQEINPALPVP